MLVSVRTSNFQGATIRPIVSRQTLYCHYCSPLNFPVAACLKTENDIYSSKFSTTMERLGVSYFPLYPLQMMLHLYMYKQFYMSPVVFLKKKRSKQEASKLETSAPA